MPTSSLVKWTEHALRSVGQLPARHHRFLMNELENLSAGRTTRLMIQMPPGSAKSTYTSILLPAWWLARHPRASIITASHTAALASHFGRLSRGLIAGAAEPLGYHLTPFDCASTHWSTSSGGQYYAVGVRGAIIGRRADIAIIDDPVKSQADADNITRRNYLWDWYRCDLIPRLKPAGRIILVMTRWHPDDLCGRLLADKVESWRCITLPAIADQKDQLRRAAGEPLWPEWEDTEALHQRRATIGERAWSAQFQQTPTPETGGLFKVSQLGFVDSVAVSDCCNIVRAWDLAATDASGTNDPDWTVGVKLMSDETGRFTILDVTRLRGSSRQVEDCIVSSAHTDGHHVGIGLPQDPGQAGKSQISYLVRLLAGYHIQSSRETGSKLTRASPVASQIEAGNVTLVRGSWNHAFIEELRDFPFGIKDDQVDALSHAFGLLVSTASPPRHAAIYHMAR